jgi:hypothetical protein
MTSLSLQSHHVDPRLLSFACSSCYSSSVTFHCPSLNLLFLRAFSFSFTTCCSHCSLHCFQNIYIPRWLCKRVLANKYSICDSNRFIHITLLARPCNIRGCDLLDLLCKFALNHLCISQQLFAESIQLLALLLSQIYNMYIGIERIHALQEGNPLGHLLPMHIQHAAVPAQQLLQLRPTADQLVVSRP